MLIVYLLVIYLNNIKIEIYNKKFNHFQIVKYNFNWLGFDK
jgi:hypothetical protein